MTNGTRRGWGVSVTPRPLFTPGKTQYPFYRRLGGPQGQFGQVRKPSSPTGIRSPGRSAPSQLLYRLRYPAHSLPSSVLGMLQSAPSDCAIIWNILWSALFEISQVSLAILHQSWWHHEISFILMLSWVVGKERSHMCSFGFLSSYSWRSRHVVTQFFVFSQSRTIDCLSKCFELTQMKFPPVRNVTDSD